VPLVVKPTLSGKIVVRDYISERKKKNKLEGKERLRKKHKLLLPKRRGTENAKRAKKTGRCD